MSNFYTPKRTYSIFKPGQVASFKISRSKIDLFLQCPRCFYMDRRLGIARPPGFPFNLNNAVDKLLKKEFDIHRVAKSRHPLMEEYNIDAVPFQNEKMDDWRNTRKGIQYIHEPTNLLIMGAIDDVWINSKDELHIVDYKATSKKAFDKKIEFDVKVIPYEGKDDWIEQTILDLHKCLNQEDIPEMAPDCDYCRYRKVAAQESARFMKKKKGK